MSVAHGRSAVNPVQPSLRWSGSGPPRCRARELLGLGEPGQRRRASDRTAHQSLPVDVAPESGVQGAGAPWDFSPLSVRPEDGAKRRPQGRSAAKRRLDFLRGQLSNTGVAIRHTARLTNPSEYSG